MPGTATTLALPPTHRKAGVRPRPTFVLEPAARNRPVRVCFMIDRLLCGGTESQLVALIEHLDRSCVQPFLCLLDGEDPLSRSLEPNDCPTVRLGVRHLHSRGTLLQALCLARFLRRHRIDVLQCYFPDSTYLGALVGTLARVPHIVRTRNNLNHWMTSLHRRLGRLFNRFITKTVANCEACRQAVLADEAPDPGSVLVLENGVDLDRFLLIPAYTTPATLPGPRRVGVVANLRAVKGLDVFVRAAARVARDHPEVKFLIAGEGSHRRVLEDLARDKGLGSQFELPGSVADVPAFLAGLHVAVLCSRSEGMSNALLEYMAAGRAIVATAVGATPQVVRDGVEGLLVPPDDAKALARAIERLLCEPALAGRLGTAARHRARQRYSREAMIQRFEAFYLQLADARGVAK
jgi:glycosyltransferase involved in cell wall biosynthesis